MFLNLTFSYVKEQSLKRSLIGFLTDENACASLFSRMIQVYNSYGWRSLLVCYRAIERIFPVNTKRRMLVKLFLYSVTNTKSVLKGFNKNNLRKFLKAYGTVEPSVLENKIKRNLTEKTIQPSKVKDASLYYATPVELFANVEILKPSVEKNGILVVDRFLPTHNRDSGSLRAFSIMKILANLGYRVTFLPDDLTNKEPYAGDLIRVGVAVLNGPLDVEKYLEKKGPGFSYVILSRPEQA